MLKQRSDEAEIMDDLEISGEVVNQTLRELDTINRLLGGNGISISAFKKMAGTRTQLTFADLGCGGGDIMVQLVKWAQKRGIDASFTGIDANPHIIAYAKQNTSAYPQIGYESWNIWGEEFKKETFDIIHCCLFIHHFSNEELIDLFAQLQSQSRVGVIINDLHRHPLAYWSIKWLTAAFSRSAMVKNDAAVSVARSFKRADLEHILEKAGITDYRLSWKWAFRWKLIF